MGEGDASGENCHQDEREPAHLPEASHEDVSWAARGSRRQATSVAMRAGPGTKVSWAAPGPLCARLQWLATDGAEPEPDPGTISSVSNLVSAPAEGGAPSRGVSGQSLLMVNVAVALFGLAGVLGALADVPSPLVVLGRVVFGGLALLGVARLLRLRLRVRRADAALLVVQGILLAVHWATFFQSIAVAGVAIGLISFATFPLFTAAIEPLVLGTTPNRLQLVAALGILAGVWVLVPEFSLGSTATAGIVWGLAGAATFALLTVLNRRLGRTYPGLLLSLYQNGVAAIVLLPVLLVVSPAPLWEPWVLLILLVLGIGCTAVAHTLFIAGLRRMTAQLASLLASLEPVWGIALGVLLLGEHPSLRSLVGGSIIVGATIVPVLFAYRASARHNAKTTP